MKRSSENTQEWTQNKQLLLFLAQIVVSRPENRAREGGCPGAFLLVNRSRFASWGVPLFVIIFQSTPSDQQTPQKVSKWSQNH